MKRLKKIEFYSSAHDNDITPAKITLIEALSQINQAEKCGFNKFVPEDVF